MQVNGVDTNQCPHVEFNGLRSTRSEGAALATTRKRESARLQVKLELRVKGDGKH